MSATPVEPADNDQLFDKLDQLLSQHQGWAPGADPAPVPTLTEAVDAPIAPGQEIPVLRDAIELPAGEAAALWSAEQRRQLQVALYLRLRQRLDQAFEGLLRNRSLDAPAGRGAFTQALQALRNALPGIVRESVDQALSGGPKPD